MRWRAAVVLCALSLAGAARAQEMIEIPYEGAPPPPPAVTEPPPAPAPPRSPGLTVTRLLVRPGMRTLYRTPFAGVTLGAELGNEGPRGAWYFTADLLLGASFEGLATFHPRLGFYGEAKLDRIRLGAGARMGVFVIRRATSGKIMEVITWGPRLGASIDLYRFAGGTVLLASADLSVEAAFVADTPLFGAELGVGLRF